MDFHRCLLSKHEVVAVREFMTLEKLRADDAVDFAGNRVSTHINIVPAAGDISCADKNLIRARLPLFPQEPAKVIQRELLVAFGTVKIFHFKLLSRCFFRLCAY